MSGLGARRCRVSPLALLQPSGTADRQARVVALEVTLTRAKQSSRHPPPNRPPEPPQSPQSVILSTTTVEFHPRERIEMTHRLSEKDTTALTATCSVCGPRVSIAPNGQRGFVCATAKREGRARYRQAHPDRAKEARRFNPSAHRLQNRKGGTDNCVICGPVESIAHGWGYMCPNRAAELGWKPEPAPVPLCPTCRSRHLDGMGACPECDAPLPDYDRTRPGQDEWYDFEAEARAAGLTVREDPMDILDDEPAVAGWKTLGSNRPYTEHTVRPEYAALYGGKR